MGLSQGGENLIRWCNGSWSSQRDGGAVCEAAIVGLMPESERLLGVCNLVAIQRPGVDGDPWSWAEDKNRIKWNTFCVRPWAIMAIALLCFIFYQPHFHLDGMQILAVRIEIK